MRCVLSVLVGVSWGALLLATPGCSTRTAVALVGSDTSDSGGDAIARVKVFVPQCTTLKRTTTQPAAVHANNLAKIYAKVTGYLKQFNFDIGQRVKKDDVLGVLWVPELDKGVESQQKIVERLAAEVQRAESGVQLARANLEAAKATVAQAQAEVVKDAAQVAADGSEHKRIEGMFKSKAVAEVLLEEEGLRCASSQAAQSAADAGVLVARAQVHVCEAKLKTAEADQQIAQVETEVARKKLGELEAMSDYATLRAPFDGVVTQRQVDLGDLVRTTETASHQPLFTVAQIDTVRIRVMVPENDAPWVHDGNAAELKLQSLPDRVFGGKVSRRSANLDESTRTMVVEIDLPNPQGELLPGMYGEATIVLEERRKALTLPARAVRHDEQGRSFVYTAGADGLIHRTEVTIGLDNGTDLEILRPFGGSERVIDASLATLKDGQRCALQ